jgi:hypothetical protein
LELHDVLHGPRRIFHPFPRLAHETLRDQDIDPTNLGAIMFAPNSPGKSHADLHGRRSKSSVTDHCLVTNLRMVGPG